MDSGIIPEKCVEYKLNLHCVKFKPQGDQEMFGEYFYIFVLLVLLGISAYLFAPK